MSRREREMLTKVPNAQWPKAVWLSSGTARVAAFYTRVGFNGFICVQLTVLYYIRLPCTTFDLCHGCPSAGRGPAQRLYEYTSPLRPCEMYYSARCSVLPKGLLWRSKMHIRACNAWQGGHGNCMLGSTNAQNLY